MGFVGMPAFEAQRDFGITRGLVVAEVDADSPASRAGLRPLLRDSKGRITALGDILLGYQGKVIESAGQFMAMLEFLAVAGMSRDEVVFDVLREGQIIKVALNLKKPKAEEKGKPPAPGI